MNRIEYLKKEIMSARKRRSSIRVLETGTSFYSHGGFTKLCRDNLSDNDTLDSVEYKKEHISLYLSNFGESDNVKTHLSDSLDFIENTEHKYDLVFLDSKNDDEHIFNEFMGAVNKMQNDGVILVDDSGIGPDGERGVLKSIKGVKVHKYCVENGIEWSAPCDNAGHGINVLCVKMSDFIKRDKL